MAARHKNIIGMLEEINVKVITRIARLGELSKSWATNLSLMLIRVLEENIDKSINHTIEFNGVTKYEILDGYKQHDVCLR